MSVNVEDHEAGVKELHSQYGDLWDEYEQLVDEYSRTSEVVTLRKALEVIQDVVDRTASNPDLDFRAACHTDLGRCQLYLFDETGDLIHLERAIDAGREGLLAASEPSHLRSLCAANLSDSLAKRYLAKGTRDDKDLTDALAEARVAVASTHDHEDSSYYRNFALSTLAARLRELFQLFGGDCYLDEAIQIGRELVSKRSDSRAYYSMNLGIDLSVRVSRYRRMEDLMAAKTCFAEALDAFPKGHINHATAAASFADCLIDFAKKTNEAHWLDEANGVLIPLEREATSEEHLAKIYHIKSNLYDQKYKMHNKVSDLDRAVEAAEEGLKRVLLDSPHRAPFLEAMCCRLASRAEVVMSQEDINAAVEYATEYLALAMHIPALIPGAHTTIGDRLRTKYRLFGGVPNLTASIDAHRNALRLSPEDDVSRPRRLHCLGTALCDYFDYTGQVEWLNEAIQLQREAACKVEDSDPDSSMILHGLSISLCMRHELTGNSQDLVEAVSTSETAAARAVGDKCTYVHNLSIRLKQRYEAEGNIEDLERATVLALEALSANGGDRYSELLYQITYANALGGRHEANGESDMHDLDLAIVTQRKIVAKTPESNPLRVNVIHNLGLSLEKKCLRVEDRDEKLKALREAHDLAEQCVNETAQDDRMTPVFLGCLGLRQLGLALFMDESDEPLLLAQLKLSATTCQRGFNKAYDTPRHRIQSGELAGVMYMRLGEWDTASKILSECIKMFRRVSPISLTDNDRQRQLRDLSGISSAACASYLAQGMVQQGIEILEAGRGIMASIAMRIQDDCLAVKEADGSLHARYIRLRQALSQPLVPSPSHFQDVVAARNSALKEFEEVENLIRGLPGLEKFNEGLSSNEMRALAVHGPLVALCTIGDRCEALIITTEAIQALPLPALTNEEIKMNVQLVVGASRLSKARPTKQATANKRMRALLSWLWDAVVSPVLEHLRLTQGPANEPKSRLWWVTSGELGLLPLHAAGKGKRQPGHNSFAHVISSYVSSFEALAFARERQSTLDTTLPRIALVTMPQTPGRLAKLDTDQEARAIREVLGFMDPSSRSAQLLELRQCSVEEVVQHLQSTAVDIFHFACHAEPDPNDPSKTSLILGSDPTAPSPDLLSIRELRKLYGSRMRGPPPRLVYLSACCTAQQYELRLIDENIQLAAAFQLLGFPAVVGTLWEADDSAAVVVARAFYQELFRLDESTRQGTSQFLPGDNVARALHFAVYTFRQQKIGRLSVAEEVLLWANFVHIGA